VSTHCVPASPSRPKSEIVHAPLHTVSITDSLSDAMRAMREHGVRRLPIVDREARLVGIASMDDVLVLLGQELAGAAATITGELRQERRIGAAVRPRTP
jgi:Mg/Co/Ni transporter MgtE